MFGRNAMFKKITAAAMAFVMAGPAFACDDPGKQAAIMDAIRSGDLFISAPQPVPLTGADFEHEDGSTGSLLDLRGVPAIVSFWYPECTGCLAELPSLNAMLEEYGDRTDITFLSLSVNGSAAHVQNFLRTRGYDNVEAHRDPKASIFLDNCLLATPTHLIVDSLGRVTDIMMGAQPWDSESATQMIENLIAGG